MYVVEFTEYLKMWGPHETSVTEFSLNAHRKNKFLRKNLNI